MKKLFLLICLLGLLSSCVSLQNYKALDERVAVLEKVKVKPISPMLLAEQAGARKFWWRNTLLGNTSSTLDGITGAVDGDACLVITLASTTATGYIYVYDDDGTYSDYPTSCTTECTRVAADGMTTGAWQLVQWYVAKTVSAADDGYHYINVSNSGAFAGTPADGDCFYRKDTNDWCCYSGAAWQCISHD